MPGANAASYAPLSSFTVTFAPVLNEGSSLTEFTVIVNVCVGDVSSPPLAVPPSSDRYTLTTAVPFAFAAGVNERLPVTSSMSGCTVNNALLSLLTLNVSVCVTSGSLSLIPVANAALYAPLSSFTVTFAPVLNEGSSLTEFTVIVNVCVGD